MRPLRFDRTRAALRVYDAAHPFLHYMELHADSEEILARCDIADVATRYAVREAFADDTADCNTREQAHAATLEFMRQCVERELHPSAETPS